MSVPELESYYCALRKYRFEKGEKLGHFRMRRMVQPLLLWILMLERFSKKHTLTVTGKRSAYAKNVIYASTHIGGDDVQRVFEAIRQHAHLLLGDPKDLYKDAAGLMLFLNGCISVETNNKEDRRIAYHRAVELLNAGESLLIYPEGAWNIIENVPVMELYRGTASMALETNTDIVPLAIEQNGNDFFVNIGEPISPQGFSSDTELTRELRDALATLKWATWERIGMVSRRSLGANYRKVFADEIAARCELGYTIDDVERTRYHTKAEQEHKTAFAHLDRLIPSKENAFLWRKR